MWRFRLGKVYLSPALEWLEEEEAAAAYLKWKMMWSEEKAFWKSRAEEMFANNARCVLS